LATDEAIDRFAEMGVVASVQPNFLKWAVEDGLYASRLGNRNPVSNRVGDLLDAGVEVAFGSDGMPLDPLLGVHWTVNAPEPSQRVPVTDALRAYTLGAAYAGFDEQRLGTISPGKRADFVALEQSPWDETESIRSIDVGMTVVDGEVVFEQ
jgi:Predicted metal-dependent hydrolase with the TIM-barrel fold